MRRGDRVIQLGAAWLLGSLAALAGAPALGATSHTKLWQPRGKDVTCGIAVHDRAESVRLLCSATAIPAPRPGVGFGDPGFVFLRAHGRPVLARLSQDTFEASTVLTLAPGSHWSGAGVSCSVDAAVVRCVNRSGHGFTVGRHSYAAF